MKSAVPIEYWHQINPWGFSNQNGDVVFDFVKEHGFVFLTWMPDAGIPRQADARTSVWLTRDGFDRLLNVTSGYLFERSSSYFDAFPWFAELDFPSEIASVPLNSSELTNHAERFPDAALFAREKLAAYGHLLLSPQEYKRELQKAGEMAAQGLVYLPREFKNQSPSVLSPTLSAHFQQRLGLPAAEIQALGSYDGTVTFRFVELGVCFTTQPDDQEYFCDFEAFRLLLALVEDEDPRCITRDVWMEWSEYGMLAPLDEEIVRMVPGLNVRSAGL